MEAPTRREVLASTAATCVAAVVLPSSINSADASDAQPVTHQVEIQKFKFFPDQLTVKPGDTIVWTNFDIAPHTATAEDKSWDTGTIKKGQAKSVVVKDAMARDYFCRFHPHMKASLRIA